MKIINWKKLFFLLAIMTAAGMVLQTYTLPPKTMAPFYTSLNGSTVHLSETLSLERSEQFHLVPTAPVVSLNSSSVQSVPVAEGRVRVSLLPRSSSSRRRRRRDAKIDRSNEQKAVSPPPPPRTPPTRLQVEFLKY